jgi:hypothetical protein
MRNHQEDVPAFPTDEYYDEQRTDIRSGMTLRDYFAAKAMTIWGGGMLSMKQAAETAYQMADAMLEARNK